MDAGGRIGTSDLLKRLIRMRLPVATDQKVGGSSPSERAQVRGPLPDPEGAFLLLLGATLGATGKYQPPNGARLLHLSLTLLPGELHAWEWRIRPGEYGRE